MCLSELYHLLEPIFSPRDSCPPTFAHFGRFFRLLWGLIIKAIAVQAMAQTTPILLMEKVTFAERYKTNMYSRVKAASDYAAGFLGQI